MFFHDLTVSRLRREAVTVGHSCGPESESPAVCRAQLGELLTRSTCQLQHDLVVWFVQFKIEILKYWGVLNIPGPPHLKYWGVGPPPDPLPRIDAYGLHERQSLLDTGLFWNDLLQRVMHIQSAITKCRP